MKLIARMRLAWSLLKEYEEEQVRTPVSVEDAVASIAEYMKWYNDGMRSHEEWAAAVRAQAKHYP